MILDDLKRINAVEALPDLETPAGARQFMRMRGLEPQGLQLDGGPGDGPIILDAPASIETLSTIFCDQMKIWNNPHMRSRNFNLSADLFRVATTPIPELAHVRFRCARIMARYDLKMAASAFGFNSEAQVSQIESGYRKISEEVAKMATEKFRVNKSWLRDGKMWVGDDRLYRPDIEEYCTSVGIEVSELLSIAKKHKDSGKIRIDYAQYRQKFLLWSEYNFFKNIGRPELETADNRQMIYPRWIGIYRNAVILSCSFFRQVHELHPGTTHASDVIGLIVDEVIKDKQSNDTIVEAYRKTLPYTGIVFSLLSPSQRLEVDQELEPFRYLSEPWKH